MYKIIIFSMATGYVAAKDKEKRPTQLMKEDTKDEKTKESR